MNKYELIIKSVSFNVNDPDQIQMLQHAEKRQNFSGYIRRLIQRDMESKQLKLLEEQKSQPEYKILMKGLI